MPSFNIIKKELEQGALLCYTVTLLWIEMLMMMIWPILISMGVRNHNSKKLYKGLIIKQSIGIVTCAEHLPSQQAGTKTCHSHW